MFSTLQISRAVAEGLASWLEFERHCGREGLFSERYLAMPIAQILSAESGGSVEAEHNHPVLSALKRRGRPPQLDFAVTRDERVSLVMETKWFASRRITPAEVVWDCVRLELAAHKYACDALLVVAGEHGLVHDVLDSESFRPPTSRGNPSRLLSINSSGRLSVNIESPKRAFGPDLHEILRNYPSVEYPRSYVCGTGYQYPRDPTRNRYSVVVWQIRPEKQRWVFKPQKLAAKATVAG